MASVGLGLRVDVACVALCRKRPREQYWAQDYQVDIDDVSFALAASDAEMLSLQVYLSEDKCVPRKEVETGLEPDRAARYTVQEQTGLKGEVI